MWDTTHPRIQLVTVEELLDGKEIDDPHMTGSSFKHAPRHVAETPLPDSLFDVGGSASQDESDADMPDSDVKPGGSLLRPVLHAPSTFPT